MTSRLLVDANLLVLYAVGTVNRRRIEGFNNLSLYLQLQRDDVAVINFTHLRAQAFGL